MALTFYHNQCKGSEFLFEQTSSFYLKEYISVKLSSTLSWAKNHPERSAFLKEGAMCFELSVLKVLPII